MRSTPASPPLVPTAPDLAPRLLPALRLLLEATELADRFHRSGWDFALEIEPLGHAGLTNNDLRGLAGLGLVEHAVDVSCRDRPGRSFHRGHALALPSGTCVVLTAGGVASVRAAPAATAGGSKHAPRRVPYWDAAARTLYLDARPVKHFRRPAPDQARAS